MRSLWVDFGNDLDYAKARSLGITAPYYDIRDPRLTRAYLADVKSKGFAPGVYAAWNWGRWSGAEFAEWVHQMLKPLNISQNTPSVHLNVETHDVPWILSALRRWRELRPAKATGWTLEGHQGGLFDAAAVAAIVRANVEIMPQAYTGSMERFESAPVVLDLIAHGFPASRIVPFYDAAQAGLEWATSTASGVLYTQGRLP